MSKKIIPQPQSVNFAFDELLDKMYISNVQNRLRQLNEPAPNDCKRWIWELIQNAKDSISTDNNRTEIFIEIVVRENEVEFTHNGSPFTAKAQLGLLYKYSEGKSNNSESTGRFGTGFLTTHALSKTVSIEGDVYTGETEENLCGFSATMYRDGLDEAELLSGIKKMKKEMVYTEEVNNKTTYTYQLKTQQNKDALILGLDNFLLNISQTLLFCQEISSIQVDNNGIITKIERNSVKKICENIFLTEFEIQGETNTSRYFIYTTTNNQNQELSDRFKTDRKLRLTACVEVDNENNIIENKESPSHFCVLPLVGSESHIMPIYLNSPDFEPDSERESLILNGADIIEDKNVISDGGINRMILKESIILYEELISFLTKNNYNRLYLLAKGLKENPRVEKAFDKDWFKENIINKYRNILVKYPIVETEHGRQKLFNEDGSSNIIIPKDTKDDIQHEMYGLCKELFSRRIPLESISKEWAQFAWKGCGVFKVKDLCEFVQNKETIDAIETQDQWEWINSFLQFISKVDETLLKEYNLIPNRAGVFISLNKDDFSQAKDVKSYTIDCLKELGEDLYPILMNENIHSIDLTSKITSKDISQKINDRIGHIIKQDGTIDNLIKALIPIIQVIPNDESIYSLEFINKQKRICDYVKDLYPELEIKHQTNNYIDSVAWQKLHNWCIESLIETVSGYKNLDSLPSTIGDKAKWLNLFIGFVSKEVKEGVLDKSAIIPNQNGKFCFKSDLANDINIPEALKSKQAEKFSLLLKKNLLHQEITTLSISNNFDINGVVVKINNIFTNNTFTDNLDLLHFAIFLVSLLPDKASVLYKSQKNLQVIVSKYYYARMQRVAYCCDDETFSNLEINQCIEGLWTKANDKIITCLKIHIAENKTINVLQNFLLGSDAESDFGDTMIFLNDFYDYLSSINKLQSECIVPNQNGVFCSVADMYFDNNIPEKLKEILILVDSSADFKNILAEKSLTISAKPSHSKEIKDIASVIDEKINFKFKSISNWDDENFKEAINLLMVEWFPKNKDFAKKIFPTIYIKRDTIEMNVLWSLEERQRMQKARSIDPDILDQFIKNSVDVKALEEEKNRLAIEIEKQKAELLKNTASNINTIFEEFPDITVDKIRELLKMEERINSWNAESSYVAPNEEQEKRNFENGYKGEAYIYKQLINSGKFKQVSWPHKSDIETGLVIVDFEGDSHFINENMAAYDLSVETTDGECIYIEVKSTRTTLRDINTIALPISTREWNYISQIKGSDRYCLARVFDVENQPEGHYLLHLGEELSKIIKTSI